MCTYTANTQNLQQQQQKKKSFFIRMQTPVTVYVYRLLYQHPVIVVRIV